MDTKTYMELVEIIEGQRSIINKQANAIVRLVNQCAEQEDMIDELMKGHLDDETTWLTGGDS